MARFTRKLTTITFEDAAGTPDTITVGPGQGDCSISNLFAEGNYDIVEARNRGVHDGLVEGDDLTQEVSLTIELKNETLTEAAADRITDWFAKTGSFASAVSVDSTVWAWKMVITMSDGTNTAVITLPKFRGKVDFSEGQETHTLSITGTNYLAPVIS